MLLTFDDGPGECTGALLDLLGERGISATFFVLGEQAAARPQLLRRIAAEGHRVGNHSWDHPVLPQLPAPEQRDQLVRTSAAIERLLGEPPTIFRPPYGASSPGLEQIAAALGMTTLLWDVDTRDWQAPGAAAIAAAVRGAQPGEVVLLHDGRRAGEQTIEGLRLATA
ncbi:MAG: hypothetical protein NVSMB51_03300 [Solirubrobacteraceae bacterium]